MPSIFPPGDTVTHLRPHKHIVLLLVTNGELALRLLVLLGKSAKSLDGLALKYRHAELDVGLGVFVTGLLFIC